ncbi:SDR family oxidoreductase [Propioniciclava soli]|uniref:SDR family oxidoreductase n=1 Tax=Propioniciclava soli TaxID=2775081 RepID=A0ABZ3C4C1_9ACTN|nr:SDR family oxidoreductase [Propioniciclava soli]
MRVLITGGTGTISRAVVARVLADGHDVAVLNRGNREPLPEGVDHLVGDVSDEAAYRAALGSREFDAVVQFVAFAPDQVERDLRVLDGRAGQYVLISSASTYTKPLPHHVITEDTPQANPYSQYARDKIACEDVLRGQDGGVRWTIVRPSHTYGERSLPVNLHFGSPWAVVQRMLDHKPVIVHGDGESLWTLTWNADFAVGLAGLLGHPDALGRAVHITSDESLTWNAVLRTIGEVAGAEPEFTHVSTPMLTALRPELEAGLTGDKASTVVFDNTLVKSLVPAFRADTSWRQGVERAWAWLAEHPDARRPDPEFDAFCDDVVRRVRAWA